MNNLLLKRCLIGQRQFLASSPSFTGRRSNSLHSLVGQRHFRGFTNGDTVFRRACPGRREFKTF
jgi:hypothetical protein